MERFFFSPARGAGATVEAMLERGAEVNRKDMFGMTPLQHAVSSGDASLVRVLLRHGAGVREGNSQGKTAPALAKEQKNAEITRLRQQKGARE